jgi:hypothetical protein
LTFCSKKVKINIERVLKKILGKVDVVVVFITAILIISKKENGGSNVR